MDPYEFFSPSYATARRQFKAFTADAPLQSELPLVDPDGSPLTGMEGEPLAIDIAGYGNTVSPRHVFLHTSGVHGVEGYAGSAIQLALVKTVVPGLKLGPDDCVLFVHAVNPFGMSWHRRWNENNVDLNRNFLTHGGDPWADRGTSESYRSIHHVLNPEAIGCADGVTAYAAMGWQVVRHGYAALKQAVVEGQDAYPEGLFYGGRGLEQSNRLLQTWLSDWLQQCHEVVRVVNCNVHTGLGPYGQDTLLVEEAASDALRQFGAKVQVQQSDAASRTIAYHVRGTTESGLRAVFRGRFPAVELHAYTQEFGTYHPFVVLRALRAENCAWQGHRRETGENLPAGHAHKRGVLDVFCVRRLDWMASVLRNGLEVFEQSLTIAFPPP